MLGQATKLGAEFATCSVYDQPVHETMGLKSSVLLQEEDIAELQKETGFSPNQIRRLYSRFTSLDKSTKGTLSRVDFLRIPELAINPLGERIIDAFFMNDDNQEGGEETCNFRQFVRTLAYFRPFESETENPLNTRDMKLKFAFKIYDLDNDGKISKDDLMQILHMMVGMNISDEQLSGIADRAINDADIDHDGTISFDELKRVLENVDMNAKMSIRFLA